MGLPRKRIRRTDVKVKNIFLIILISVISGCGSYSKGYLAGQKHVIDSICEGWAKVPKGCESK